ncbi:MAG: hypothetical protein U0271_05885 [Polyangiaceae bacterium]
MVRRSLVRCAPVLVGVVALLAVAPSPSSAGPKKKPQPAASASSAPDAGAPQPHAELPADKDLPALPTLPPIKPVEPDAAAVTELDGLLARLLSSKNDIRDGARADLGKLGPETVPAIHARIQSIRESLDRDRAPRILEDTRKAVRKSRKGKSDGKKKKGDEDDEQDDWLTFMLERPRYDDPAWKDLTQLLAMIRALTAIGTTPAVRELLELRANFGEFLRIDLTRQLDQLKDKAIPALLEARKHNAQVVVRFAELTLDRMGKVTPGEAVATNDPDVLADILRAFGYTRDVDAVRVVLSFANHDRRKVREAARQAISGIGEPGRWQLRDAYQDLTGEKVDKSIPWDVLARRIFALYDQGRLTELHDLFASAVDAAAAGRHDAAVEAFDKVLARDPLFDQKAKMAPSYFEVAKTIPWDRAEERLALLRKARRLAGDEAAPRIDAEIAYSEAKVLIDEGRPDRVLLKRAIELDPTHNDAKALLESLDRQTPATPADSAAAAQPHYGRAGAIAAAMVLVVGLALALFHKRSPTPPAPPRRPTRPPRPAPVPDDAREPLPPVAAAPELVPHSPPEPRAAPDSPQDPTKSEAGEPDPL